MFKLINKLKNRKGFTLVELIVVLAVLGVIMAIAVPRFTGVQDAARVDADNATIEMIEKLAELDYIKSGETDGKSYDATEAKSLIDANIPEGIDFQSKDYDGQENTITIDVDEDGEAKVKVTKN